MNQILSRDSGKPMVSEHEFGRVIRQAKKWGVEIRGGRPPELERSRGWWGTPFLNGRSFDFFGIWLPERAIYWDTSILTDSDATPNGLLHELAHVVVGGDPGQTDEIQSGMLAFEYQMTRKLKLTTWTAWMSNYTIGYKGERWTKVSTRERHESLLESFKGAMISGILDARGAPTYRVKK